MPGRKSFSPDQRRRALRDYMRQAGHAKILPWAEAAGVSESSIRNFLAGDSDSLSDRTYTKLARADGVPVSLLMGEEEAPVDKPAERTPVRSYVGAGDEVVVIPGDHEPIDWVEPPPGMEDAEATIVRGRSMLPLYHDKDVLYHRRLVIDPIRFRGEVVVAQVKSGKRYVKLIEPGSRKTMFNLVSINPAFAPIEDQKLEWVGPIEWVRKRRRF